MDLIDDADRAVSDHIVGLLNTRYLSASNPVEIFLWTHQGSLERLVRKLAPGEGEYSRSGIRRGSTSQDGNTPSRWAVLEEVVEPMIGVYSQAAWLLRGIFTRILQGVVGAFEAFRQREGVDDQTRNNLLRVLASEALSEVRDAALCAGLPVQLENLETPNAALGEEEGVERLKTVYPMTEKPTGTRTTKLGPGQRLVVELFRSELQIWGVGVEPGGLPFWS